jgi:transcriptional regulator with XRE-family HTH domain
MARRRKSSPFKVLLADEVLICQRVSRTRRDAGLSQAEFAARIRTTRDRVASIEYKRVSLKWPVGLAICRAFNVSQLWLAKGMEPIHPFFDLDKAQDWNLIPDATPFSAVCNGPLSEELALRRGLLATSMGADSGTAVASGFYSSVHKCVSDELVFVPEECWLAFLEGLPAALRRLAAQVELRSMRVPATKDSQRKMLTEAESSVKLPPVKSQLKNLLADLNRLTKESGKKTELADFLGAPLASVSRWLSGEREPGGETTLKMLRWVQQQ